MRIDLSGRTAIIAGASGGLGHAMAQALADAGAGIVLVARNAAKLEELAHELSARSGARPVHVFTADLTDESSVAALGTAVAAACGHPQILINSAGTNIRKNLVDFTLDEFRSVIDSSLISTFPVAAPLCRA
jgi:NAD(P)-dependent dehydrogenase (short-subunit alcohol dehydrogenase family)